MTARTALVALLTFGTWVAARTGSRRMARRLPGPFHPGPGRVGPAGARGRRPSGTPARLVARVVDMRTWRRFDEQLPDAVAAIARGLRSGASLRAALAEAAAVAPEPVAAPLHDVVATADAGVPLAEALDAWAQRCPRANVLLLVAALSLAHDTGGASAQAVDGVAATLRRRQAARAEAVALATQARTSAYVLAGAPVAVCAVTLLAGGGPARFLLGTPTGLACLVAGLLLEALGGWWMARLTGAVGPARALP
jgi:tight adherence protein B